MTTTIPNHHGDHEGFSGLSGLLAGLTMVPGRRRDAELAADLVELVAQDLVVDIGSGPGTAARLAAARGADVVGVEPASVMRALADVLTPARLGVTWLDGVAEDLPVDAGSATVIWSIATVHHWPDLDGGLAEVRRVLAADGRFLALERRTKPGATGLASHGWTDEQADAFAAQCRSAGFTDAVVGTHPVGRKTLLSVLATRAD